MVDDTKGLGISIDLELNKDRTFKTFIKPVRIFVRLIITFLAALIHMDKRQRGSFVHTSRMRPYIAVVPARDLRNITRLEYTFCFHGFS